MLLDCKFFFKEKIMSFNNREIKDFLRKAFINLEVGNTKEFFHYVSDDVLWIINGTSPLHGTHHGHAEAKELFHKIERLLKESLKFKVKEMIIEGSRAAITLHAHSKTLEGDSFKYDTCWIVEVENKKISKLEAYTDSATLSSLFESGKPIATKR